MSLKSLTYTSFARLDLTADDLAAVLRIARDLNALDGITGLLVYNGTHFLQIVEGSPAAVDGLIERLRRDKRHSGVEVRDEQVISERAFPEWSMELAQVKTDLFEAKGSLAERLPPSVPPAIRDRLLAMTELISVEMPD